MEMTVISRLIKEALGYLLTVQEVSARPEIDGVDLLAIIEETDKAVRSLLTADVILSECNERVDAFRWTSWETLSLTQL